LLVGYIRRLGLNKRNKLRFYLKVVSINWPEAWDIIAEPEYVAYIKVMYEHGAST